MQPLPPLRSRALPPPSPLPSPPLPPLLSPSQTHYAALDAFVLLAIHEAMRADPAAARAVHVSEKPYLATSGPPRTLKSPARSSTPPRL